MNGKPMQPMSCPICERPEVDQVCHGCLTDWTPLRRLEALPDEFLREGADHLSANRFDEAISCIGAAIGLNPELAGARVAMSAVYEQSGSYHQAVHWLNGAQNAGEQEARLRGKITEARIQEEVKAKRAATTRAAVPAATFLAGVLLVLSVNFFRTPPKPIAELAPQQLPQVPAPVPVPSETHHEIRTGDSYWRVARQRYGEGMLWQALKKHNSDRHMLHPGETLRLPVFTFTPK